MRYLRTFVVAAPVFAVLYHFVASRPLPWWPDSAIMGGFMGALASFALLRLMPLLRTIALVRRLTANDGSRQRVTQK